MAKTLQSTRWSLMIETGKSQGEDYTTYFMTIKEDQLEHTHLYPGLEEDHVMKALIFQGKRS